MVPCEAPSKHGVIIPNPGHTPRWISHGPSSRYSGNLGARAFINCWVNEIPSAVFHVPKFRNLESFATTKQIQVLQQTALS